MCLGIPGRIVDMHDDHGLAMGTVDGNPPHPPAYHQFVGSVAPWHDINDDLPKHETWAED